MLTQMESRHYRDRCEENWQIRSHICEDIVRYNYFLDSVSQKVWN